MGRQGRPMSDYLSTTFPSDYHVTGGLCCTIGFAEGEDDAARAIAFLQEHGDEWRPVEAEEAGVGWWRSTRDDGPLVITETWLVRLQRVRVHRHGPPEMVSNPAAKGGVQLLWPNGQRKAASFFHAEDELAGFLARGLRPAPDHEER